MHISDNDLKSLLLSILILILSASHIDAKYLWPLPDSDELTSLFGSFRSTHYHAGTDIRTFGKIGYNAIAVEDGYLWRVVTSWWGYGKVIYVRLSDGNIAVYAHLSEFTPEVNRYVRENQTKSGHFKVDLFPEKDRFRFKQGESVAKTGQSGVGAPHLHFEIRDSLNLPFNPLQFYSDLKDTKSPRLQEITFRPLDGQGFINGKSIPLSFPLSYSSASKTWTIPRTPTVIGKVGLEIKAIDVRDNSKREYSVAKIKLYLDDRLVFETSYDSLSFENWNLVDLDYSHFQKLRHKTNYHNLYAPFGQKSPCQNQGSDCQTCRANPFNQDLLAGNHAVRIEVSDLDGNASMAKFDVRVLPEVRLADKATFDSSKKNLAGDCLSQYSYLCRIDSGFAVDVDLFDADSGLFRRAGRIEAKTNRSDPTNSEIAMSDIYNLAQDHDIYQLIRLNFRQGNQILTSVLAGLTTRPSSPSINKELIARIDFISEVRYISAHPVVRILPERLYHFLTQTGFSACFSQPVEIGEGLAFPLNLDLPQKSEPADDLGLLLNHLVLEKLLTEDCYFHRGGREDKYQIGSFEISIPASEPGDMLFRAEIFAASSSWESDKIRITPADRLLTQNIQIMARIPKQSTPAGTALYSVSPNGAAAFVGNFKNPEGFIGGQVKSFGAFRLLVDSIGPSISGIIPKNGSQVGTASPRIRFRMSDNLAGIDSDTLLTVHLDGELLICDYDVDNLVVQTELNQNLKKGKHELIIEARDRLGNATIKRSTFTYQLIRKK